VYYFLRSLEVHLLIIVRSVTPPVCRKNGSVLEVGGHSVEERVEV